MSALYVRSAYADETGGQSWTDTPSCSFICYFVDKLTQSNMHAQPTANSAESNAAGPATTDRTVEARSAATASDSDIVKTSRPAQKAGRAALLIIGESNIRDIDDLDGKPVGLAGGVENKLAVRIFASRGIHVQEYLLDRGDAFDGLSTGDLAAIVVFAPKQSLARNLGGRLHIVPLGSEQTAGVSADHASRTAHAAAN